MPDGQHPRFPLGPEGRACPRRADPAEVPQAHLFPIFFLHTMHTFSSVMMHFTCWCKIRSSWTWEGRESGEGPRVCPQRLLHLEHLVIAVLKEQRSASV